MNRAAPRDVAGSLKSWHADAMFESSPSIAAILVPFDRVGASAFLSKGLLADGFRAATTAIPKAQRAFPTESVSFGLAQPDPARPISVIIAPGVAQVFELACLLSKASPEVIICAFRRFAATSPVAKVIFAGKPQWKDGEDPDHEVFFDVPDGPSAELRLPSQVRIETSASEILSAYGEGIAAITADLSRAGAVSHWVHRRSRYNG